MIKSIIIGGSAGSFDVIVSILEGLDSSIEIPIIIVIHRPKNTESYLEKQLQFHTNYIIKEVETNEPMQKGFLYTAPADYHLLLEKELKFSLDTSEAVNYSRPAIDVTFESFSEVLKEDCCGILLSGSNNDGALGLKKIAENGGLTIVQDLKEAEFNMMPKAAIKIYNKHQVLSTEHIINKLNYNAK